MEHLKEWIEQVLNDNGCSLYELEWLKEEATRSEERRVGKECG